MPITTLRLIPVEPIGLLTRVIFSCRCPDGAETLLVLGIDGLFLFFLAAELADGCRMPQTPPARQTSP